MEKNKRINLNSHVRFFVAAIIITALTFQFCACGKEKKTSPPSSTTVTVLEIVQKDVPVNFEFVALTQSSHQVNIQARVSGFLDKRLYTEGRVVKKGQILFQMDPKPFQAQLDHAKAALAKQQAVLETARLNLARTKPLAEQKALSQKDLDDATGQYESSAASVEQAKAQVETAKLNLSYTTITSPINGISGAAQQSEGTYISPQNSLLTTVAVLSPIWVNFSLSENEMQNFRTQVKKGLLQIPKASRFIVEVILVDGTIHPYTGHVTFADPSYNPETGTFSIRANVENPDGSLRPNQYVRARMKGAIRPNAVMIPQRSVQKDSKGHFVWVVGKDNKVEMRPVTVGEWQGDDWFISEGLRSGERIVVDGGLTLRPGNPVTVKPYQPAREQTGK